MIPCYFMNVSNVYVVKKAKKLSGSSYSEIYKKASQIYKKIKKGTKRRPYIRSSYFGKEKIFLSLFWHHLNEKLNMKDKIRRLKFFNCAIELLKKTDIVPISKENVDKKSEILHRFKGVIDNREVFFVQVKENKQTGRKDFISVFPM